MVAHPGVSRVPPPRHDGKGPEEGSREALEGPLAPARFAQWMSARSAVILPPPSLWVVMRIESGVDAIGSECVSHRESIEEAAGLWHRCRCRLRLGDNHLSSSPGRALSWPPEGGKAAPHALVTHPPCSCATRGLLIAALSTRDRRSPRQRSVSSRSALLFTPSVCDMVLASQRRECAWAAALRADERGSDSISGLGTRWSLPLGRLRRPQLVQYHGHEPLRSPLSPERQIWGMNAAAPALSMAV